MEASWGDADWKPVGIDHPQQAGSGPRETEWNETGAIMSGYRNQFRDGVGDAKRMLQERLARKELGDAAYDKAVSYADDRTFKIFGVLFIVVFAVVVLGVVWLGY